MESVKQVTFVLKEGKSVTIQTNKYHLEDINRIFRMNLLDLYGEQPLAYDIEGVNGDSFKSRASAVEAIYMCDPPPPLPPVVRDYSLDTHTEGTSTDS